MDWFSFLAGALLASIVSALAGVLQKSGHMDAQQEALDEAYQEAYQAGRQSGLAQQDLRNAQAKATAMTLNVNQRREINKLRDERDALLQRNMHLVQECRELHTRLELAHAAVGEGKS